jgi:hypothetical protein
MTQLPIDEIPETDTAQAFEDLRREVSLARHAVEGLTAARERVPDYSVTLGQMADALKSTLGHLDRIERSPAVKLSPEAVATELVKASAAARTEDGRLIHASRDALSQAIGRIDGIVKRGQAAEGQARVRLWHALGGLLGGILIWAILPGLVARALPASWHVPEWMAARTMGLDRREAGAKLIASAARSL